MGLDQITFHLFYWDVHELGEFSYGDGLVLLFFEEYLYVVYNVACLAFGVASYIANIFGTDADAGLNVVHDGNSIKLSYKPVFLVGYYYYSDYFQ